MQMKSINLSAMANNSVNQLRELYPERDCEVAIEPNLTARGDSRLVQLLLDNLIGNAWKYTGRRDRAHIEFGKQNGAEKNIFFVKDDGIGFDMKYADKLFHPFQRLHPKEEFEGTGIGLATSRRIVNRHGGKIWAESQPDKGSIFYFTL